MEEKIVLVAKSRDERNQFKELKNYTEVFYHNDLGEKKISEFSQSKTKVYIIRHFGGASTVSELCEKRREWKEEIGEGNVFIIPISEGSSVEEARKLYEKIAEDTNPDELKLSEYENKWKELCCEDLKKKIILNLLPFCLYCESIHHKEELFENLKEKIKKSLEEILEKIEGPASHWKNLGSKNKNDWDELKKLIAQDGKSLDKEKTLKYIKEGFWKNILEDIKNFELNK